MQAAGIRPENSKMVTIDHQPNVYRKLTLLYRPPSARAFSPSDWGYRLNMRGPAATELPFWPEGPARGLYIRWRSKKLTHVSGSCLQPSTRAQRASTVTTSHWGSRKPCRGGAIARADWGPSSQEVCQLLAYLRVRITVGKVKNVKWFSW